MKYILYAVLILIANGWIKSGYNHYTHYINKLKIEKLKIKTQTIYFESPTKNIHIRKVYGHLEMLIEYYEAFGLVKIHIEKLILKDDRLIISYKILGNEEKVKKATEFLFSKKDNKESYFINKEIIKAKSNFWLFMKGDYDKLK